MEWINTCDKFIKAMAKYWTKFISSNYIQREKKNLRGKYGWKNHMRGSKRFESGAVWKLCSWKVFFTQSWIWNKRQNLAMSISKRTEGYKQKVCSYLLGHPVYHINISIEILSKSYSTVTKLSQSDIHFAGTRGEGRFRSSLHNYWFVQRYAIIIE